MYTYNRVTSICIDLSKIKLFVFVFVFVFSVDVHILNRYIQTENRTAYLYGYHGTLDIRFPVVTQG